MDIVLEVSAISADDLKKTFGYASFMNLLEELIPKMKNRLVPFTVINETETDYYLLTGSLDELKARCFDEVVRGGFLPLKNQGKFRNVYHAMIDQARQKYNNMRDIEHVRGGFAYPNIVRSLEGEPEMA